MAATSPYLAITGEHHGQHSLLQLRGELDAASRADLRRAACAMLNLHRPQLLVLDLSALSFADCAGLAVIASIHRRQEEQGRRLLITGVQPIVQRLLRLTGLAEHLHVDTVGNGMVPPLPG